MNFHKKFILMAITLFAVVTTFDAFAQKEIKTYKNAENAFYNEDFADAVQLYQETLALKPGYKDAEYKLEICLLLQPENRERSLNTILSYRETKGRFDKFYNYWLGRIYVNHYLFPEAVDAWKSFLKVKAYKSKEIVEETRDFIADAEKLVQFFDNTDNFEVHRLESPINSTAAELTPVYFEGTKELLYASARQSKDQTLTIYHSIHSEYDWSAPTAISNLGQFSLENANIEVINADNKVFFYDNKKGSLMYSEPSGDGWSTPKEFDSQISKSNIASHFFINEHEDRIIFATKNKKNGLDLMESFKDPSSGKWNKPTLLATPINTIYDEDSPYLSPDETALYFCSNRPGGVGGYDVYVCKLDPASKTWGEPENLGWPINSPDDDLQFKMNEDQESGYLVSNRIHSFGSFDIFLFWKIEKAAIKGKVYNALTNEPLSSGEIRFHPSQYLMEYFRSPIAADGSFETEIISDETFRVEVLSGVDTLGVESYEVHDAEGEYITHFQDFYAMSLNASDEEKLAFEQKIATINQVEKAPAAPVLASSPIKMTEPGQGEKELEPPVSIPVEEPIEEVANLGNKYRVSSRAILRNLYFSSGTSKISKDSEAALNELLTVLKQNPDMKISIEGHTDNQGSKAINLTLSKERAKAVMNWLMKKGIDKDRLKSSGYGESQPLASNDDEKNGRDLNRRIEIRVLE